jgi:hypothetical protein
MSSVSDISVVIRCYTEERWAWLVEAVASASAQSLPAREVIVVVDGNPALLERARAHMPSATVVENDGPRGSAGAWNCGIAASAGEVVAFLDDDAVAAPDWLKQLALGYDSRDVVGVGGTIEPEWLAGRPRWFPSEFDWVVGCSYTGAPTVPAAVRNLIGCNMSFRRRVFAVAGGFRPGIGHVGGRPLGCDETELCIRIGRHWPWALLRHNPLARVRHKVPAARARWSYYCSRCAMEGRSKALVAQLVGGGDATTTERAYVSETLPAGVWRGVAESATQLRSDGLLRAGAIVAGLAITTSTYSLARLAQLKSAPVVVEPPPALPEAPAVSPGTRAVEVLR